MTSKIKAMVCISSLDNEIKLIKKGKSSKNEANVFYYPTDVVWSMILQYVLILLIQWAIIIHNACGVELSLTAAKGSQFCIFCKSQQVFVQITHSLFLAPIPLPRPSWAVFLLIILPYAFNTFLLGNENLFSGSITVFPLIRERS